MLANHAILASEPTGYLNALKRQSDPETGKARPPKSLLRPLQLGQRSRSRGIAPDGGARRTANLKARTTTPRPSARSGQRSRPLLERRGDEARRPQTRDPRRIRKIEIKT